MIGKDTIFITSEKADYNKLNLKTKFYINVNIRYEENIVTSDNFYIDYANLCTAETLISSGDIELAKNLNIYPNPTKGIFNISFVADEVNSFELTIIDAFGKLIEMENKEMFVGEYTKQVDLSEYPRGIYMVQIKTNNSFITKRVVVQ